MIMLCLVMPAIYMQLPTQVLYAQRRGVVLTRKGELIESSYDVMASIFLLVKRPPTMRRGCTRCGIGTMSYESVYAMYPECDLGRNVGINPSRQGTTSDFQTAILDCLNSNCTHLGSNKDRTNFGWKVARVSSEVYKPGETEWSELNVSCILNNLSKEGKRLCEMFPFPVDDVLDAKYQAEVDSVWQPFLHKEASRKKRQLGLALGLGGIAALGGLTAYGVATNKALTTHVDKLDTYFKTFVQLEEAELNVILKEGFLHIIKEEQVNLHKQHQFDNTISCELDSVLHDILRHRSLDEWKQRIKEIMQVPDNAFSTQLPRMLPLEQLARLQRFENTTYFNHPSFIEKEGKLIRAQTEVADDHITVHMVLAVPLYGEKYPMFSLQSVPIPVGNKCVKVAEKMIYLKNTTYYEVDSTCDVAPLEVICARKRLPMKVPHCISTPEGCNGHQVNCENQAINTVAGVMVSTDQEFTVIAINGTRLPVPLDNGSSRLVKFIEWNQVAGITFDNAIISSPMENAVSEEIVANSTTWDQFLATLPDLKEPTANILEAKIGQLEAQLEQITVSGANSSVVRWILVGVVGVLLLMGILTVACIIRRCRTKSKPKERKRKCKQEQPQKARKRCKRVKTDQHKSQSSSAQEDTLLEEQMEETEELETATEAGQQRQWGVRTGI